jgi:hypothetical protein
MVAEIREGMKRMKALIPYLNPENIEFVILFRKESYWSLSTSLAIKIKLENRSKVGYKVGSNPRHNIA